MVGAWLAGIRDVACGHKPKFLWMGNKLPLTVPSQGKNTTSASFISHFSQISQLPQMTDTVRDMHLKYIHAEIHTCIYMHKCIYAYMHKYILTRVSNAFYKWHLFSS